MCNHVCWSVRLNIQCVQWVLFDLIQVGFCTTTLIVNRCICKDSLLCCFIHVTFQVFRGLSSTKAVEDTFGLYADEQRQHKAGRLGRLARWHRAEASPLLAEFDRKGVKIDNKAKFAASVPKSKDMDNLFVAKENRFSMGQGVLDAYMGPQDRSLLYFWRAD